MAGSNSRLRRTSCIASALMAQVAIDTFMTRRTGGFADESSRTTHEYLVISWGDLCYKSDVNRPAVFVFVKDGALQGTALPRPGGYDSANGEHWTENTPARPTKPSLQDVPRTSVAAGGGLARR